MEKIASAKIQKVERRTNVSFKTEKYNNRHQPRNGLASEQSGADRGKKQGHGERNESEQQSENENKRKKGRMKNTALGTFGTLRKDLAFPGVSNLWTAGCILPRMDVNGAQHKMVSLLKTLQDFFFHFFPTFLTCGYIHTL